VSGLAGATPVSGPAGATATDYTAGGKITGLYYNGGAASVGYAYDPRSTRLTSIMSPAGSGAVFYREYTYTPAGDVATIKTATSGSEYAYAYDGLHRLTQETFNGAETLAWEYDGLGNLTAVNVAEGVEYSPLGDSVEVSFDVRNRPVAALRDAGLTVFADDGSGTRVKKTDPDATATYYVSDSFEVIGGVHTTYEFLGNVRFAQARGAEVTYFVQDHLHSTSASLAPDGTLSESGAYLPFGADRTPASVTATSYGFTDQERDRSTGFYNYDARQYDPEASRFISPDSLLPNPYDPQQLNRYAYARNNPLKYVDPSGHEPTEYDIHKDDDKKKQQPDTNSTLQTGAPPTAEQEAIREDWVTCYIMGVFAYVARGLIIDIWSTYSGTKAFRGEVKEPETPNTWGNPDSLADHFERHGKDFGAKTPEDYAAQASKLLQRAQKEGLPTKIDPKGTIRVYDPATNTFGAFNPDGTTKTFFKPTSPGYWDSQPGVSTSIKGN
jgi:RHS repeat-associated protein